MDYYGVVFNSSIYHHGINGQRWGVRRYQNEDGTLTELGKRRLAAESEGLNETERNNRAANPAVNKWVEKDLQNESSAVSELSKISNTIASTIRKVPDKKKEVAHERLDLSKMTDKELRDRINRELLERQYNNVFNPEPPPQVNRGREIALNILDISGGALAVGASALTIALMIKQLGG